MQMHKIQVDEKGWCSFSKSLLISLLTAFWIPHGINRFIYTQSTEHNLKH